MQIAYMVSYLANLCHEIISDFPEISLWLHTGFRMGNTFDIVVAHL